jgi:ribonuclease Z
MIDICLLGCGGMMPLPNRWLAALLIRYNGKLILIDCGEGTQIPIKLAGWGFKPIQTFLSTHFHADHISGLPGFLLTLGNSDKNNDLNLYGPPGFRRIYEGLTVVCPELPYEVNITELSINQVWRFNIDDLVIKSMPVEHTLPCLAYTIELRRAGKFDVEKAKVNDIPMKYWSRLQKGEKIIEGKRIYVPNMVLGQERKGLKIAYCTDTRPIERIVDFVKESDLFICEGNYGDIEKNEKAINKKHMLFSDAANLAKSANVKELILTHFSPSLNIPEEYLEKTRTIFPNTYVGKNLLKRQLNFN